MATTTNYGWTTPDNTALVKDGASAIRTLGSSVDTSLKSLSPGTTAGDVDYYTSSTAKARLGIGSTGQVLTVAGGVPSWSTPASPALTSGQVRVDTLQSTTSTSYVGLTTAQAVTVTTGTKVLVIVSSSITNESENFLTYASFAISGATTRAASDTWAIIQNAGFSSGASGATVQASYASFQTVTAGSNTFTAQFKSTGGSNASFRYRQLIVIDLGS